MKLLVAILTRSNAVGLVTLIGALEALRLGEHKVVYAVRIDDDDVRSTGALAILSSKIPNIFSVVRERPSTLGAGWNEALSVVPDWDIAIPLPGDVVPLCEGWDAICAEADKERDAFSWWQTCAPSDNMYPTISRRWYEAAGQSMFCERFPFWFTDHWFAEVHHFAIGEPLPIVRELKLGGRHGPTSGMRDLPFWFKFFAQTRGMRREEAASIRRNLGLPIMLPQRLLAIEAGMKSLDEWQRSQIPIFKKRFGADKGEPSKRYLKARAAAEKCLMLAAG